MPEQSNYEKALKTVVARWPVVEMGMDVTRKEVDHELPIVHALLAIADELRELPERIVAAQREAMRNLPGAVGVATFPPDIEDVNVVPDW